MTDAARTPVSTTRSVGMARNMVPKRALLHFHSPGSASLRVEQLPSDAAALYRLLRPIEDGNRRPARPAYIIDRHTGCWLWQGSQTRSGYATRSSGVPRTKLMKPVYRRVYEIFCGPIPEGMCIDHLCEITVCINPAHLEPVTFAENSRRAGILTAQKVREIRSVHATGTIGYRRLAKRYGVHPQTISNLIRRISWSDVA